MRVFVSAFCVIFVTSTAFAAGAPRDAALDAPAGVKEFRRYIRLVLEKHPEVKALKADSDAKSRVPSQEYSLPNPQLSIGVENLPVDSFDFTREDMTMKKIGLTQAFPAPGKRGLRKKVAEDDAQMAAAMVGEKRLELIEQARLWFYELQSLLKVRDIVLKNKKTLKEFIDLALVKYSVGDGTQQDVLAAQLEYSKMNEYFIGLDQQVATISRMLNVWGELPPETGWENLQISPLAEILAGEEELVRRAVEKRPLFRQLDAAVAKADDGARLARMELKPDYSVSVSYGQRENTPMRRSDLISAEIMFDLPVYRSTKQDQMIAQSEFMADKSRLDIEAEKTRLRRDMAELMEEQRKNQKLVELYDTGLLPQAQQAVDASLSAYRVNKVDYRWIVMNQTALFEYEIRKSRVEYDLLAARTKLLRLLGEDDFEVDDGK